jgi:ABC-type transport system involved in multi-copper enzyme maturation permease subunit
LIAGNFLRENRWPIALLLLWIVLSAAVFGSFSKERVVVEDIVFYVRQQALYIVVFSAFLASSAIHNERKSRRILLVLSKAVSRAQYLMALLMGTLAVSFIYGLAFGACCTWLASRSALPWKGVWLMLVIVMAGSAMAAALALFFSTFLNPFIATALTAAVISAPSLAHADKELWFLFLPGLPLLVNVLHFNFHDNWSVNWAAVFVALLEALLFWALATLVFGRRDIAVPIE